MSIDSSLSQNPEIAARTEFFNATPESALMLSGLEAAFNVDHPEFAQYTRLSTLTNVPEKKLLDLGEAMLESDHPVVIHAAGWAMAESAMRRPSDDSDLSLPARLTALDISEMAWSRAGKLMETLGWMPEYFPTREERHRMEFWSTNALCYLPNMRLAARMMAGNTIDEAEWALSIEQTNRNLIGLGEVLLSSSYRNDVTPRTRGGNLYETSGGLLLLRNTEDRLVLPASLRQDNNVKQRLRADLITLERSPRKNKTLLQMKGHKESLERGDDSDTLATRLFINAHTELCAPGGSALNTMNLLMSEHDGRTSPEQSAALDELGQALHERITNFWIAKKKKLDNRDLKSEPQERQANGAIPTLSE